MIVNGGLRREIKLLLVFHNDSGALRREIKLLILSHNDSPD